MIPAALVYDEIPGICRAKHVNQCKCMGHTTTLANNGNNNDHVMQKGNKKQWLQRQQKSRH